MIKGLPVTSLIDFVKYAIEQEQEDMVWEQWNQLQPMMLAGFIEYKPYEEFKRKLLKPSIKYTDISYEEVEKEMLSVVAQYESKKLH